MTLQRDGKAHWPVEAHLLDDLRMTLTGTEKKPASPHPDRPQPGKKRTDPARARKLVAARARAAERKRAKEAGELT